jgi:hypothetical protein
MISAIVYGCNDREKNRIGKTSSLEISNFGFWIEQWGSRQFNNQQSTRFLTAFGMTGYLGFGIKKVGKCRLFLFQTLRFLFFQNEESYHLSPAPSPQERGPRPEELCGKHRNN